jgi:hypothetical protein
VVLPRGAALTVWLYACLRGSVGPDDFADAARGDDPQHLVVDWPGLPSRSLVELPGAVVRASGTSARVALPVAGDLVGLGGPAAFNRDALEAGEAVLLEGTGLGLVPGVDARTVVWQAVPATVPPLLDPREEGRQLRSVLAATTAELTRLDVASWQPQIADLLLDGRHRPDLDLPRDLGPRAVEDLERAVLCLEVTDLAAASDGGAASAYEIRERLRCLADLARAARRVVVAVCSDSLAPS